MIFFRNALRPLRELVHIMPNDEFPLIAETTNVYFRDLYNHTVQAIYTLDSFHETVSGLVDLYMSSIRQRRNEVMQVLTIMASLSISLTFIVGIYGMNFVVEPELKWHWGYPMARVLMLSCAEGL